MTVWQVNKALRTNEWREGHAVWCAAIEVLVVFDTCEADDRVDKTGLLWSAVHVVRISHLHWPRKAVVRRNRLGTFFRLLGIWRRKRLGLKMREGE